MFELQQQQEEYQEQEDLRELQESSSSRDINIKILKQFFHWIVSHSGLWNSTVGRDFIYSIESLESGISVIDQIITPKEEEIRPLMYVVAEENRNQGMEPYEQGLVRQIERDNIVDAQPHVNLQRNRK